MPCDGLEGRGTLLATALRAAPVEIVEDSFETLCSDQLFEKVFEWRRRAVSVFFVAGSSELFVEVERE
ncbi:hypothetical protein [Streptomyces sp. NPDC093598]|uniref:hypothetical protein n=1 Tax=Streptomyces sp. NPDC093598 TaxID=3366046 RepID=UPI003813125E